MDIPFYEKQILECVRERDIDLLLVEEVSCNDFFRSWFFSLSKDSAFCFKGIWHSVVSSGLGESDMVALFVTGNRTLAYLIENKIDAPVQREQAIRYRFRGDEGVELGMWDSFKTMVVGPKAYIDNHFNKGDFDIAISYEAIVGFLKQLDDSRFQYRANVFNLAIDQQRRGYSAVKDDQVTLFWASYYERLSKLNTAFYMKEKPVIVPAGSSWIYLFHDRISKEKNLVHKLHEGYIDLQLSKEVFERYYSGKLDQDILFSNDIKIVQMKHSIALRIETPSMDRFVDFNNQIDAFHRAMKQLEVLFNVFSHVGL